MLNYSLPLPAAAAIAALVPTIVGFIWYHPKLIGTAWMNATGLTRETAMKGFNMPLVFGLSLFFSFLLSISMSFAVIHQMGFHSMMDGVQELNDPNSPTAQAYKHLMTSFSGNYRSFRHGALHGFIMSIFTILPVIATIAMFERKSFKYIAINTGYWMVCLTIMGAIVCHFAALPF